MAKCHVMHLMVTIIHYIWYQLLLVTHLPNKKVLKRSKESGLRRFAIKFVAM